jgi:hypothetical protein
VNYLNLFGDPQRNDGTTLRNLDRYPTVENSQEIPEKLIQNYWGISEQLNGQDKEK